MPWSSQSSCDYLHKIMMRLANLLLDMKDGGAQRTLLFCVHDYHPSQAATILGSSAMSPHKRSIPAWLVHYLHPLMEVGEGDKTLT